MDRIIELVVAATILLVLGFLLINVSTGSLGILTDGLESQQQSNVCELQVSQAEESGNWEGVDQECLNSNNIEEGDLGSVFESDLTN
jgi:hypothetical protein